MTFTNDAGWEAAEMPAGVDSDVAQVTVLALECNGGFVRGYCRTIWVDRTYRPMERFDLPVTEPAVGRRTLPARVLESGDDPFDGLPYMTVSLDDAASLSENGWEPQEWLNLSAKRWLDLNALSKCIQTESHPLLGAALLGRVIVHDVENLDASALRLLPADVRDGLERALISLPD